MRQAGQFAPAFDLLQAAWNDAPGNEEILSALARLYQSGGLNAQAAQTFRRSEEHTSELQSLMRTSYAVFCLKKQNSKLRRRKTNTTLHSSLSASTVYSIPPHPTT